MTFIIGTALIAGGIAAAAGATTGGITARRARIAKEDAEEED